MDKISICYYPTTTVFIDDSRDFLENFHLQLDQDIASVRSDNPKKMIEHLNNDFGQAREFIQLCYSEYFGGESWPMQQHTLQLDLSAIHKQIYDANRFKDVSVVMVDFDMPEMNGIEFCKNLKNRAIRRVLLTGKADEQVAIKAFNEGIIHQYIKKSDPNVFEKVTEYIYQEQQAYFQQLSESILKTLSLESPHIFNDQAIANLIKQLSTENDFREYYMVDDKSILFLTDAGEPYLLAVKTPDDIEMDKDFAMDSNAPDSVIEQLKNKTHIAVMEEQEDFATIQGDAWKKHVHPAKELNNEKSFLFTLIKNPKITANSLDKIMSYEKFLDTAE